VKPILIRPFVLTLLILAHFVALTRGQEVTISDPGLNAAILEALGKPAGPLATNNLGSINFTDVTAHLSSWKAYRAVLQSPPASTLFIPSRSRTGRFTFSAATPPWPTPSAVASGLPDK